MAAAPATAEMAEVAGVAVIASGVHGGDVGGGESGSHSGDVEGGGGGRGDFPTKHGGHLTDKQLKVVKLSSAIGDCL